MSHCASLDGSLFLVINAYDGILCLNVKQLYKKKKMELILQNISKGFLNSFPILIVSKISNMLWWIALISFPGVSLSTKGYAESPGADKNANVEKLDQDSEFIPHTWTPVTW